MTPFKVLSGLIATAVLTATAGMDSSAAGTVDRDISGQRIELSKWRKIEAGTLVIDVSDLGPMRISKAQERWRNKRIVQQRGWFEGGWLLVEHSPEGLFGPRTTEAYTKPDLSENVLKRFFKRKKQHFVIEAERAVQKPGDRRGWLRRARGLPDGRTCRFASLAFLGKGAEDRADGREVFDTLITVSDCSGKRTLDDFENFALQLRLASPPAPFR